MPTYVFKGRNRMNEVISGERVADNREALRQILRREQVTLTSVKEKGREIGIPKLSGRRKVKSKDLAIFTRQFSVMIDAGLPLVQCLDILAQQQANKYFQQVLTQVRQDVEEGSPLPLPPRIVVGFSSCLAGWGGLCILVVLIGLAVGIHFYYKTTGARKRIDTLLLKAPILRTIFLKISIARFSRTLSTLLSSG